VVCGGYGKGAALLALDSVEPLWEQEALDPRMGTPVLHEGFLYGPSQSLGFVCVDAGDGTLKWHEQMDATQVTLVGGTLVIQCRSGEARLAQASADGCKSLGTCRALSGTECWTPAVVNGGRLFCRSWDGELAAFDLTTLVPPVVEPPVVVTEALLARLQAAPLAEREAAISRLARVADADLPALLAALTERLRDTWTAQASAGEVLRRLGTRARAAAPALVARLPRRGEWPLLFQGLGGLGPAAREAIPELEKLQAGTDARTAKTIADVIERIRTGAP